MGLFARFFGRERDGRGEGGPRCMECGMTGGEHTDWCPLAAQPEPGAAPETTSQARTEAEGPQRPQP